MSPPAPIQHDDDHAFMELFSTLRAQSVRVARGLKRRVLSHTEVIDAERLRGPSVRSVAAGIAVQFANLLGRALREGEPGGGRPPDDEDAT